MVEGGKLKILNTNPNGVVAYLIFQVLIKGEEWRKFGHAAILDWVDMDINCAINCILPIRVKLYIT